MINTRVHNHGPDEGPGITCSERQVAAHPLAAPFSPWQLRGECVEADGCDRGAHGGGVEHPEVEDSCEHLRRRAPRGEDVVPLCALPQSDDRCPHLYVEHPSITDGPSPHDHWCVLQAGHTSQHRCAVWCNYRWSVTGSDPGERVVSAHFPLTGMTGDSVMLESKPRRVWLATLLTDLMATIDDELAELAEVRRTEDRVVASDTERVMDFLGQVWSKAAEARTAVRDSDLGYLPLPEVG